MAFTAKVTQLLEVFLAEREDLFLIELKISPTNDITVVIDGDEGVTLQDCLDASRAIENNLDREVEDFSLQVHSFGLSGPLQNNRQYHKNVGRELELVLNDDSEITGELLNVTDDAITLMLRYRKPKEIGKGKMDVEEEKEIEIKNIRKALVKIQF
ncbi:ribosome assembly cofactor RimP [Frigoriflavimonas asaccharolytica]|uniref:Ribosome maturation factor RimP n=1 Tax=Frigoriflavimonas asaccharolytica TaxID=2735899 RepID=A0A8J8KBL1_9FLAO|nr:ribosome assembly cofactor RimP [Frigoriflavimonas asaccharolytica]NRS92689.1 ribosome maturation factor RimP [Frigoriflavimonas asaccharolytica]